MEHLASVLRGNPLEFRLKNMNPTSNDELEPLKDIIDQLRGSCDYDNRLSQVIRLHNKKINGFKTCNELQIPGGRV
jgi:hypothetical protein